MLRPSTYVNAPGVPRAKRIRRKRFCTICEYVEITHLHGNRLFCNTCRSEARKAQGRKGSRRIWALKKLAEIRDKRLYGAKRIK